MTVETPAQPSQFERLTDISAAQTKEHIQEIAETYKKMSGTLHQAQATAYFYPSLSVEGLTVTFQFDSGEQLEFDGTLSGATFSGESDRPAYIEFNATFFVSPDDLVQMGSVTVSASASVGLTNINWSTPLGLPLGFFIGNGMSVLAPILWGSGTFK